MHTTYLFETDEHRALREQIRRFATQHVAAHAFAWDEDEQFPRQLYHEAAAVGMLGVGYPEAWGGAGGDLSHLLVAGEEMILAGHSVGTAVGLGGHQIALPPILHFGTDEQRRRFLPPVLRGEKIAALAVTEPGAGSDVAALATRAEPDGDHYYIVNGSKMFVTNGCRADFVTCAVRTGGEGHGGISLLVIESGTPGFEVSRKLRKLGWRASDTAQLFFDDCRVPRANLIGGENAGFVAMMMNFATERLLLAAQCVAIAELALRESIAYVRQRHAFGRAVVGFQVTRHTLAEMATRVVAARAITGEATARVLRGEASPSLAAMAKNSASEACSWVVDHAVQLHGGMGFMRETLVDRLYADARLYPIGGGTHQIMNEVIAKLEDY